MKYSRNLHRSHKVNNAIYSLFNLWAHSVHISCSIRLVVFFPPSIWCQFQCLQLINFCKMETWQRKLSIILLDGQAHSLRASAKSSISIEPLSLVDVLFQLMKSLAKCTHRKSAESLRWRSNWETTFSEVIELYEKLNKRSKYRTGKNPEILSKTSDKKKIEKYFVAEEDAEHNKKRIHGTHTSELRRWSHASCA